MHTCVKMLWMMTAEVLFKSVQRGDRREKAGCIAWGKGVVFKGMGNLFSIHGHNKK